MHCDDTQVIAEAPTLSECIKLADETKIWDHRPGSHAPYYSGDVVGGIGGPQPTLFFTFLPSLSFLFSPQFQLNTVIGQSQIINRTVYLNGITDYIDFTVYTSNSASMTLQGDSADGRGTHFSANLIAYGESGFSGYQGRQGTAGNQGNQGNQVIFLQKH